MGYRRPRAMARDMPVIQRDQLAAAIWFVSCVIRGCAKRAPPVLPEPAAPQALCLAVDKRTPRAVEWLLLNTAGKALLMSIRQRPVEGRLPDNSGISHDVPGFLSR